MKHYTTIEQSKRLLELGLSPETADMYYFLNPTPAGNIYIPSLMIIEKRLKSRMPEYDKGDIPSWSLGALLEVMPKCIVSYDTAFEGEDAEEISTTYYKHLEVNEKNIWQCSYKDNGILRDFEANTSLEAAYSMVLWLLENGYIK